MILTYTELTSYRLVKPRKRMLFSVRFNFERITFKQMNTKERLRRHIEHFHVRLINQQNEIEALNQQIADFLTKQGPQLVAAQKRLQELSNNFDVRKMAARMEENKEDYYILCGWMAETMSKNLQKKLKMMTKSLL